MMMSIAIAVMATSIAVLSLLDPKGVIVASVALSLIMGIFALFMNMAKNFKVNKLTHFIAAILVVIVVVLALANVIQMLSDIEPGNAIKNAGTLTVLLGVSLGMLAILGKMNTSMSEALKGAVSLASMVIPILAFVGVLHLVDDVDPERAIANVGNLTVLLGVALGMLTVLDKINVTVGDAIKAAVSLTVMAAPILAFVGILYLMEDLDHATENVIALSGLMAVMTAMLTAVSLLGPLASVGTSAFYSLIALMGVIGVLAVALGALMTEFPQIQDFLDVGIPLLEQLAYAIGSIVGSIVAGFTDAVAATFPKIGTYLSEFMENASGFIDGCKNVDSSVLAGIGYLSGAILAISATDLLAAIMDFLTFGGDLSDLGSKLSDFMNEAEDFIEGAKSIDPSVATAMKSLASAILTITAADILNGISDFLGFTGESSLEDFGEQLGDFGEGLNDFYDEVKNIDADKVTAAANAATAIVDMAKKLPNEGGAISWFTGDNKLSGFAANLYALGEGIYDFHDWVQDISSGKVEAAANAAMLIVEMAKQIPNEGGVVSWFTGDNKLDGFAGNLEALGEGIRKFANKVDGVDSSNITAAANAASIIVDMAKKIPNDGGAISWFTGDNKLSGFADNLYALGEGICDFAYWVSEIDAAKVTAAANATSILVDVANKLPNEGGVVSWFTGDNKLEGFSTNLSALGEGIWDFAYWVEDIDTDAVTGAANAASILVGIASMLPNQGGVVSWFTGDNSLEGFADNLDHLGEGIYDFAEWIDDVDVDMTTINAAATAANTLCNIADKLPTDDNLEQLSDFGIYLKNFGSRISDFFTTASDISTETIASASALIDYLADIPSKLDDEEIRSVTGSIYDVLHMLLELDEFDHEWGEGFKEAIDTFIGANLDELASEFTDASDEFKTFGKDVIKNFVAGVKSMNGMISRFGKASADTFMNAFITKIDKKTSDAKQVCKDMVKACSKAISKKTSLFKSAGKDLGDGLIDGIKAKEDEVYDAAYNLGQIAVQGEKDGQASKSPSKLTTKAGKWLGEGLIIGMQRMYNAVYKSGNELGETATDPISSVISKIADTINSDMDMQPTIRPVLDLSDVRSGAGAIGGMLGLNSKIGVAANIGAISSSMTQRQNGTNSEVVSAINKLRKDIANNPHNTYTINGITYDDDSVVTDAIRTLVRAAKMEGRT
jgi:hypothetical protein